MTDRSCALGRETARVPTLEWCIIIQIAGMEFIVY